MGLKGCVPRREEDTERRNKSPYQSVWDIPVTNASGIKYESLRKMEPNLKAAMIVNVASE